MADFSLGSHIILSLKASDFSVPLKDGNHFAPTNLCQAMDSDNGSGCPATETAISSKRKRLSRKEQKQRKKQQRGHVVPTPSDNDHNVVSINADVLMPDSTSPTTTNSENLDKYRTTYQPTPLPSDTGPPLRQDITATTTATNNRGARNEKSLGKWFPKAVTIKQPPQHIHGPSSSATAAAAAAVTSSPKAALVLLYQYIDPVWTDHRVAHVMEFLVRLGKVRTNVAGRIRIAPEGLNCTLSAIDKVIVSTGTTVPSTTISTTTTAIEALHHVVYDLQRLDPAFAQTDFKFIPNLSADRHFSAFNIIPVKELVYYGLPPETAPLPKGGQHVSPRDFHRLLAGENLDDTSASTRDGPKKIVETVVIDVRNHYEAALGRFDGQEHLATTTDSGTMNAAAVGKEGAAVATKPATYVDPKMRKSTDFPAWVAEHAPDLAGKRVLLYCTGGIRCERASAHLAVVASNAESVYQLQGGIERYLQEFPNGGFWRGKNFTFDKREAIAAGNANGDGGVVVRQKASFTTTTLPDCVCSVCRAPWDRYVGKKKCRTCGVPVLVCDVCLSDRTKSASARCPLCVEQNVTVSVDDVEWTDNGVQAVMTKSPITLPNASNEALPKAAPTVLKWGGGHATEKKAKRKWKRTPCRFGKDCVRPDCLFQHPADVQQKSL
jgi:predicted sulfurtransferase